ncbi:unnamed protein product [Closterium sp. NIES-54]
MVQQVLQRFGFTYSSPQSTPLPTGHSLSAPPLDESVELSGPYPELVGCLMYLMTCTRPDLAYPLSLQACYVAPGRHRKVHWDAANRVLRYLRSTSSMGLVLGGRARVVLTGHVDASWVDDLVTQRSSQGYTFSLGSGFASWRSTRSSSILSSSCEAEIYAGAMAAQELRWLTYLLTDLGEAPRSPPVLYVDNKAMLALCQEHRLEHRTKHIALRYFLARELPHRGQLRLAYVASQANTADVFTKALQPCDHQRFCTVLGLPTRRPLQPASCPCSQRAAPAARSLPLQPARCPLAARSPPACGPLAAPLQPAHRPLRPACRPLRPVCHPLQPVRRPLAARLLPLCNPHAALWQPARRPLAALLPACCSAGSAPPCSARYGFSQCTHLRSSGPGVPPPPLPPPTPMLLVLTSLVLRMSGLLLLLVGSAAAARARVAGVVAVAAGVVVVAVVEVVEVAEVVATVGVVAGVGALVAVVVVAVGVAVVAAVGVVVVGVELFRGEVLAVARGSTSSVGARPLRPSSFTCGKPHSQHCCFSHLDDAWHAKFGDQAERPRWAELLRSGVGIFALDYDAILPAMYAFSVSNEGDCYRCVLPDPGIEAPALGASECALPGTASAAALHTYTLDSGASCCFFHDSTTLTPLSAPVPVRLADPSEGPVLVRSSIVLPSPADPSGSLSGLHLPSLSTNLVSTAAPQDAMVTTTTPGGQRVSICTCTRTGRHQATFTSRLGSSLYTLAAEPPQVAASTQVSASGLVAPPCLCRLLSHHTLFWHHRPGHPSLPRLRGMHSRLLVSGLPRSLPPLPPSPAPPCLPCVEGRQRAAPHSSSFPSTTAPLQTLHMDVWGPARVTGQDREHYFLQVVDDYTRYTTVFPLRSKGEVPDFLIPWIRAVRLQLRERFRDDLPVLRLHSDRGGEFSSDLLRDFCRGEGILQSFTLPAYPQQNGIDECRIGLVMEVARTSMIHTAAPHFLWPFAVQYAAHQLNLWPHVSLPDTSPTLCWTGKVGDESVFWDVTFDESVPFYRLFPYCSAPLPPPPLFLAPGSPLVDPLPPQGPAPSGVSQVDPLPETVPVEVAVDSGAARGDASGGVEPANAKPWGAEPMGAEPGGGESEGAGSGGAEPRGAEPGGAEPRGPARASPLLSPWREPLSAAQLRQWFAQCTRIRSGAAGAGGSAAGGIGAGGAGAVSLGGARVPAGAGGTGGAGGAGPGGARTRDPGAGGAGAGGTGDPGAGGAGARGTGGWGTGAGGTGAVDPRAGGAASGSTGDGGTVRWRPFFVPPPPSSLQPPDSVLCQPDSPLLAPSTYAEQTDSFTEQREPESHFASPVCTVCTGRRVPRPRPPPVPSTHVMALCPSSVPLRVPQPPPPESSLPAVPDPESDLARAASPTVPRLLATVVIDPSFESTVASELVTELADIAVACRLDYATALVAESESACPPSVQDECALGTNVLEDRQEDFECLAAAVPDLVAMLLAPEGDPNAPDIPTPRSYAEAIMGPYSSQWQIAMDAKMASSNSTGTYVDAVPPLGANIVDGVKETNENE